MPDRPITYQLSELFEAVAAAVPEREALVAGDRRLSYGELWQRAIRFAGHLAGVGVVPGTQVGIYARNRAEWVEAMLGAFAARAVPVNVNYRYVDEELAYVLDNADVEVLVVERSFLPLVEAVRSELPLLRHVDILEDGTSTTDVPDPVDADRYDEATGAVRGAVAEGRSSDDLYLLYTGGTTGMPKGVMWRHEDIFFAAMGGNGFGAGPVTSPAEVVERVMPEEARMITLVIAPMMHGAAQWVTFITLLAGGTLVLSTSPHFDAHSLWDLVAEERCTSITLVGDAMARPLAEALADSSAVHDTSSVFSIGSGGAIFSAAVKEQLRAQIPQAVIVDTFGASETGAGAPQYDPLAGPRFPANEWTAVLDDRLRPIPPGSDEVGRMAKCGHIPLGYYKDDAKTEATFQVDEMGVRWAIPGDHATLDAEGIITLLGRGSNCINTGGEKVYPEEVEAALKRHPAVFDALVVGVPDPRFGERVAAVVQPRAGMMPTLAELDAHCRRVVAGYKVPRELCTVEAMGRLPTGKADYAWARRQFERVN